MVLFTLSDALVQPTLTLSRHRGGLIRTAAMTMYGPPRRATDYRIVHERNAATHLSKRCAG